MPELVDVEGFRRVAQQAADRRIDDVEVTDTGVLRGVGQGELRDALRGQRFTDPLRHGKKLVLPTAQPAVLLHFGMTGSLHWCGREDPRHRHDRVLITLRGDQLRYRDMRKLTGLRLARTPAGVDEWLADLGPDALAVSRKQLADRLDGRGRALKPTLMDQQVVAGLGNLLVDEILWRAFLHPRRTTKQTSADELARLHARMRTVLRGGLRPARVPDYPSWLTGHRHEPDGHCPRCGTRLESGRVGNRSTMWCPRCQPR